MKPGTIPLTPIIKDLLCMEKALIKLLDKNKPYEKVLRFILFKHDDDDDDTPYPTAIGLSKELKLPASQIKKHLFQIHSDALQLAHDGDLFSIKKYTYTFYLKGWDRSLTVRYNDLHHVPRLGETVFMPCFAGYIDDGYFYVDSITNEYYANEVVTMIFLKSGFYNSYFKQKLDEAYFKKIISISDRYSKNQYELEKMILDNVKPDRYSL
jgi:hypothetical protein